jgi:hypothetical protein
MAYIGSTPTTQSFIAGTDSFNGTGSATNFTLSRLVNSTNDIQVVVNNVVQYPPNYSVSGNTLTISPAPSAGTNNVYVRYLSTTLQSITIPGGSTVVGGFNVTGNVGIGVTPSAWFNAGNLQAGSYAALYTNSSLGSAEITSNAYRTAAAVWNYTNSNHASRYQQYDGTHRWYTAASGTAGNAITFTEAARITAGNDWQFNSGYGSVATAYGCRAWVNFNGTGTVAIRASGNVSSITDNGTGDYTVNFTTALADANYCGTVGFGDDSGSTGSGAWSTRVGTTRTVSAFRVRGSRPDNGALADSSDTNVAVFR